MPAIHRQRLRENSMSDKMNPTSLMVNKALRKKLLKLASKEQRQSYTWFLSRLIGAGPYMGFSMPLIKGDAELVKAWRQHSFDLVKIYAPRRKLKCGHSRRYDYCEICADAFADSVQQWLNKARGENGK